MLENINNIIEKSGLATKVYIKDLRSNKDIVCIGENDEVNITSLIYVPILLATCSLLYDRKVTIKDEIQVANPQNATSFLEEDGKKVYRLDELLQIMIIKEDNIAAINILRHIGPAKVNEFLVNEGFKATKLANQSTACLKDMGIMFEKTYKRRFISPRMCDFAQDILHRSRESQMLPRLILDEVKIAQHTDSTRTNANACGVVVCKDSEYFIGVSVEDSKNTDPDVLKRHIGQISKAAYEVLGFPETV